MSLFTHAAESPIVAMVVSVHTRKAKWKKKQKRKATEHAAVPPPCARGAAWRGTRHRLQGHHHPGGKDWVLHGLARAYHVRETFMYVFTFLPCLAVMWCHTARESARLSLVE